MKKSTNLLLVLLFVSFCTFSFSSCDKGETPQDNEEYFEDETGEIDVLYTYENFKKLVKALKVDGFTLISITSGESSSDEYEATYKNSKGNYLFIKIGSFATSEPVWMDENNTYLFEGRKAEFASAGTIHGLVIFLPQIEAEFSVMATVNLGKESFESIAKNSGFIDVEPQTAEWPTDIAADHKFDGYLIEVEIGPTSADGFSKEMLATMLLTDELQKSYKKTFDSYYDGMVDHIVFPNGTYLIPPGGYYGNDLYETYEKYDRIEFSYYIE